MLLNLALAALVFVLAHRWISGSRLRARIARGTGEKAFQAALSALSLALTVRLVWAYVAAATDRLAMGLARTIPVMVLAFLSCHLIVAGLMTRPTIAGLGGTVRDTDAIHRVIRLSKPNSILGHLRDISGT